MKTMLVGIFWAVASVVVAQNPDVALEKYLTDEVVAVAYLDLSQIDTLGALEWVEKLGFGPVTEDRGEAVKNLLDIQEQLDKLADMGASRAYALFRVSDVSHGGPTWVLPVDKGRSFDAGLVLERLGALTLSLMRRDNRPVFLPEYHEQLEGAVLGAYSTKQLELLKTQRPTALRDYSAAWKALGVGHCGLLLFGDNDSRRVMREMFPKLPEPFQAIDGPLIADRLLWGGVVANFPPNPSLQLIVQTDENSSARVLQESIASGFALLQQLPQARKLLSAGDLAAIADTLTPQITKDRLTISFQNVLSDFDRLAKLMTPPIQSARQAAQRNTRMNQFKQIVLGMLNYESANGHYPPRGTYSDDGKPLLSWRVHILPYLEQGDLYDQFHLDEPWDSEHNKQLISLMPEIYADPDPALQKRNAAGRTTYVVPTGQGTVFAGPEGTLIKEITDGTSNTIILVEAASMAAPIWTRPKDWLVDFNNPWERLLRRDGRDWITAGFCDGSVHIIHTSAPAETLRRLVIIDDGESVERP